MVLDFKKTLFCFLVTIITACSSNEISPSTSNLNNNISNQEIESSSIKSKYGKSRYLCVSLPTGGNSEIIKVQNLETKELTSLPVPGAVQGMSENLDNNIIYVNAKSPDDNNSYSLFKLDLKARQISRILSFSQLGLKPTDFTVDHDKVYVTGKRGGVGTFYGNDLIKNEWFAVANNISPGKIELGFKENTFHVISYDDSYLTRTIVDVTLKQITDRQTIPHSIPFGNNFFIPSPHGSFVYVLHQLKDSFIPYAFNVKQHTVKQFPEVKTNGGILYSAIVSNDGKHLFTNVDSEIYPYQLVDGDKLIALPKITLPTPESRNMAMEADNTTLIVTHDTGTNLSIVSFSSDYSSYTVNPMYIGGSSNQIYLF
ncbi:MAG: hypothetical protein H7263_17330 [Candidatus Sericytochromatia bacterium]|nr:hypothetical protein [Candidatus Sericytochromatia bacterium]